MIFQRSQSSSKFEQQEELHPLMGECSLLYNHPYPRLSVHFWPPYFTERLYFCRHKGMVCVNTVRIQSEFLVSFGNEFLLTFFLWEFYIETKCSSPLSQERPVFVTGFLKPFFKQCFEILLSKLKQYNLHMLCLFNSMEISHFCLWASVCFGGSIRYAEGLSSFVTACPDYSLGAETASAEAVAFSACKDAFILLSVSSPEMISVFHFWDKHCPVETKGRRGGELLLKLDISGSFW